MFNRGCYYRISEAQTLGFKTDAVLRMPKILEGFLNLAFENYLSQRLRWCLFGEICYCATAVEFLVWFSGPGSKAQEPRAQASHAGSPCQFPTHLAVFLMLFCLSVNQSGYAFPQCPQSTSQTGAQVVQSLLIVVQESQNAPQQLVPVGLHRSSAISLKALAVKERPENVPVKFLCGRRPSRKLRLLMRILYL